MPPPQMPPPQPRRQIKWIDLTPEQKKQVIRIRNAESARRSRQKKREDRDRMERTCEENDRRIEEMERVVNELTAELKQSRTKKPNPKPARPDSSSLTRTQSCYTPGPSSTRERAGPPSGHERPKWFGEPF